MFQISHLLPAMNVRYTPEKKPKVKQKRVYPTKYDHWAMLQDRLAGMTWPEIAKKHGYTGDPNVLSGMCMRSNACRRLTPAEIGRMSWHRGYGMDDNKCQN